VAQEPEGSSQHSQQPPTGNTPASGARWAQQAPRGGGGVRGLDSTVSGQGPVAGCGECGDESSGSSATELVS
jgi:hypothetical protein